MNRLPQDKSLPDDLAVHSPQPSEQESSPKGGAPKSLRPQAVKLGVALLVIVVVLVVLMQAAQKKPAPRSTDDKDQVVSAQNQEDSKDASQKRLEAALEKKERQKQNQQQLEARQQELDRLLGAQADQGLAGVGQKAKDNQGLPGLDKQDGQKKQDPWQVARQNYRAQVAQSHYGQMFAARSARLFFGSGAPKHEGLNRGVQRPSGEPQSQQEAFLAQLERAQQQLLAANQAQAPTPPMLSNSAAALPSAGPQLGASEVFFQPAQEALQQAGGFAPAGRTAVVGAGTIVPLVLETGLSSQLPGLVMARVAEDVFDAQGTTVVIEAGARVLGLYNSRTKHGQTRMQLAFHRLITAGGRSVPLGAAPAVDLSGYSGVEGEVDEHWEEQITGAALSAVISGAAAAIRGPQSAFAVDPADQALGGAAQSFSVLGQGLASKYAQLEPTIEVAPGRLLGMVIVDDLVME